MKKIIAIKTLLFVLLFCVGGSLEAQQTEEKFVLETKYLLYLPKGYGADTIKKWPLMIFLHGSVESGDDLQKVKMHGPPKLIEAGKKFPFIVVSPQAPPNTGWQTEIMKSMLESLKQKFRVDPDRIYMTGLSMGGFGTWNYAEKYPDDIAAIAPVCGGSDTALAWKLKYTPVWCFHGAKDDVVPPQSSIRMITELKKYNPDVKFTLYPEANHNSWDLTYNNDSLYTWLLSQKKFKFKQVTVKPEQLRQYEGDYVNSRNDTVRAKVENEKLILMPPGERIEMKASSLTNFYWNDNSTNEVVFTRNRKGETTGFNAYVGEIQEFRKVKKH